MASCYNNMIKYLYDSIGQRKFLHFKIFVNVKINISKTLFSSDYEKKRKCMEIKTHFGKYICYFDGKKTIYIHLKRFV